MVSEDSLKNFWFKWKWYIEWTFPGEAVIRSIKRILFEGKTRYQDVAIVDIEGLGKALILDGKIQSSLADEYVYHEALVHPVMIAHGNPRNVLILGGGEGATLREVLRYKTVEKAVMIDIDEEVINLAKKHLVEWHQGAFDDERAELIIMDGRKYVEQAVSKGEKFDVVITDLVDPIEAGPAVYLYTKEFYELIKKLIGNDGIMVTQSTSPMFYSKVFYTINNTLKSVYKYVSPYIVCIKSFNGTWGFNTGSESIDPSMLNVEEIKKRIDRLLGDDAGKLRFYDEETHMHMFKLPKDIRENLKKNWGISTDKNPKYTVY